MSSPKIAGWVLGLLAPLMAQSGIKSLDQALELKLQIKENQTTLGSLLIYQEFEAAFDKEMNRAYSELLKELTGDQRLAFKRSQDAWLKFRDAQFHAFIAVADRREFGSGQGPIIAMNRMKIVRQRAVQLVSYTNGLWGPEGESVE